MKIGNKYMLKYPLILDGAMGTELLRMGVELPLPLWSAVANETCSDKVYDVHREYIEKGADVLTTNSFRTTPYAYQKAGFSKKDALLKSEMNLKISVSIAKKAVSENQLIAGSIAPIEDCYSPEIYPGDTKLIYNMESLIQWFHQSEVDIILFETMGNAHEISRIIFSINNCDLPVWLSLILKDKNHLLDGTPLYELLETLSSSKVEMLLLNCNTIQLTLEAISTIKRYWSGAWGVYPNLGINNPEIDGKIEQFISNETWRYKVNEILFEKPDIIGACCGSTPEHIRIIKELIEN